MESDQNEQGRIGRDLPSWRGSNRIAAAEMQEKLSSDAAAVALVEGNGVKHQHDHQQDEDPEPKKPEWKKFLGHIGPGFLVSMAYLDPGNCESLIPLSLSSLLCVLCALALETDLQAGANHGYELLWIVLVGLVFALIIQSLAANLGVVTGKHLAELCKAEYPKLPRICLWLLAELAVIAADIPEVIGTAFALNILFHIPVWSGVLLTGLSTLLLLGLQRYGVRKLELLVSTMVFVMAACYFAELGYVNPPASEVLKGLFVPRLKGDGATGDAIALLGALVMPHNLFLHSALVLSREVPPSAGGINKACRYFLLESGFALFVALLINIAVVSVSGTICGAGNLSRDNADICSDLTLNSASFLLKDVLGRSSSTVYAIALLASGQSSTITGTYAGQYIMQVIVVSWILGLGIIGINIYYLSTGFVRWLVHASLHRVAKVLVGVVVFPLMAIYVLSVVYLMLRKDSAVTFIDTQETAAKLAAMEKGIDGGGEAADVDAVP
ncbi:hypothetical protein Taro_036712 [Colocasia esculenta]|uniref:Uncharacterized protein n=1 Tax=Colocasia esculenta TaxID=4460 RepID=A0A843W3U1_COLES|nr:hypothetical protein [Colocasia esculenta]